MRLGLNMKTARPPQASMAQALTADFERPLELVQSIRIGGHAIDDIVDSIVETQGLQNDNPALETSIVALESALFADKMLTALTNGTQILSLDDRQTLNEFVHKLKAGTEGSRQLMN